MENPEQRVGVLVDGVPRYPAKTLDGRDYYLPPGTVHMIGGGQFVVLDGISRRYDVAQGVADLKAALASPTPVAPEIDEETDEADSSET